MEELLSQVVANTIIGRLKSQLVQIIWIQSLAAYSCSHITSETICMIVVAIRWLIWNLSFSMNKMAKERGFIVARHIYLNSTIIIISCTILPFISSYYKKIRFFRINKWNWKSRRETLKNTIMLIIIL